MAKLTLSNLANLNNQTAAVTTINANSDLIETAIENTLSRDGTSPNSMSTDLDMDGNYIINAGAIFVDGSDILASASDADLGFVDFIEIVEPSAPASDKARLYAVDSAGVTRLAYKDSAGTVHNLVDTAQLTTSAAIVDFTYLNYR